MGDLAGQIGALVTIASGLFGLVWATVAAIHQRDTHTPMAPTCPRQVQMLPPDRRTALRAAWDDLNAIERSVGYGPTPCPWPTTPADLRIDCSSLADKIRDANARAVYGPTRNPHAAGPTTQAAAMIRGYGPVRVMSPFSPEPIHVLQHPSPTRRMRPMP